MTYILGLTGSIATGKSTVSRYFEQLGFPVVDCDQLARQVVEPGQPGLAKISKAFGSEMVKSDGCLNREQLATIIFHDPVKRELLDQTLDGILRQVIAEACQTLVEQNHQLIVVDIPLLYERNYQNQVDAVMVVYLPTELQKVRLMQRDQITEDEALKRIAAQWSIERKRQLADIVINNSEDIAFTRQQVYDWLLAEGFILSA